MALPFAWDCTAGLTRRGELYLLRAPSCVSCHCFMSARTSEWWDSDGVTVCSCFWREVVFSLCKEKRFAMFNKWKRHIPEQLLWEKCRNISSDVVLLMPSSSTRLTLFVNKTTHREPINPLFKLKLNISGPGRSQNYSHHVQNKKTVIKQYPNMISEELCSKTSLWGKQQNCFAVVEREFIF